MEREEEETRSVRYVTLTTGTRRGEQCIDTVIILSSLSLSTCPLPGYLLLLSAAYCLCLLSLSTPVRGSEPTIRMHSYSSLAYPIAAKASLHLPHRQLIPLYAHEELENTNIQAQG